MVNKNSELEKRVDSEDVPNDKYAPIIPGNLKRTRGMRASQELSRALRAPAYDDGKLYGPCESSLFKGVLKGRGY